MKQARRKRMTEEVRSRLANAYMRGFRDAVAGREVDEELKARLDTAYVRGYESGARRVLRALARAERLAEKITGTRGRAKEEGKPSHATHR